jgi:predicted acyl esterase
VLDKAIDATNGLVFVSDPFNEPLEMSGLFSGSVEFSTNKKDFDFAVSLYELTPAGEYVQLAPYWSHASYVRDPTKRRLLRPGRRERLEFRSMRLMSRQLAAGSRLVAVLQVIKETGRQINYGRGKDVSDETVADAKEPLRIPWFGTSYVDVPVAK